MASFLGLMRAGNKHTHPNVSENQQSLLYETDKEGHVEISYKTPNLSNFEIINLSGTQFIITKRAFSRIRVPVISSAYMEYNKALCKNEYFLTRNPQCFSAIVDYIENGDLHIPKTVCPLAFKRELLFWRVNITNMEDCCKRLITEIENDEKALKEFDSNDKPKVKKLPLRVSTRWGNFRDDVWETINNSPPSQLGKVCLTIKIIAIVCFVFESAASTHELFQNRFTIDEIPRYMKDRNKLFTRLCSKEHEVISETKNARDLCRIFRNITNISKISKKSLKENTEAQAFSEFENSFKRSKSYMLNTKRQHLFKNNINTKESVQVAQKEGRNVADGYTARINDYKCKQMLQKKLSEGITQSSALENTELNKTVDKTNMSISLGSESTPRVPALLNHSSRNGISFRRNLMRPFPGCERVALMSKLYLRQKRNIEIRRIHPILPENDHMNHIEDIVIMDTMKWLDIFEICITFYFVFEYVVEFSFAPSKINYFVSFHSFVDLVSIGCLVTIHVYVEFLNPELEYEYNIWDYVKAFESLKTVRIIYLMSANRIFRAMLFSLKRSLTDLFFLFLFMNIFIVIIAFFMYYIEKDTMESIPNAMWWGMITITTLGYGDVTPKSVQGKFLGYVVAMCGLIVISLVVPIFVVQFQEFYKYSKITPEVKKTEYTIAALIRQFSGVLASRRNTANSRLASRRNTTFSSKVTIFPQCLHKTSSAPQASKRNNARV